MLVFSAVASTPLCAYLLGFYLGHDVEQDTRIAATLVQQWPFMNPKLITNGEGIFCSPLETQLLVNGCLPDVPLATSSDGVRRWFVVPTVYRNSWWVDCTQAYLLV